MNLFLTGANISPLNGGISQTDVSKSLGGYISNSPVPNGQMNTLFSEVSLKGLNDGISEVLGLGLVNDSDYEAPTTIKIVTPEKSVCKFEISAIETQDGSMERLPNKYSEPIHSSFYDATFNRAQVVATIEQYGQKDERITFNPFGITATCKYACWNGTFKAIKKVFERTNYEIIRYSEKTFIIQSKDETVVTPVTCNITSTGNCKIKFLSEFENNKTGEVSLGTLQPGQMVGLWIKRTIKSKFRKNEQLLEDKEIGHIEPLEETAELVITYTENNPFGEGVPMIDENSNAVMVKE
jgi:hypothetical protein